MCYLFDYAHRNSSLMHSVWMIRNQRVHVFGMKERISIIAFCANLTDACFFSVAGKFKRAVYTLEMNCIENHA